MARDAKGDRELVRTRKATLARLATEIVGQDDGADASLEARKAKIAKNVRENPERAAKSLGRWLKKD